MKKTISRILIMLLVLSISIVGLASCHTHKYVDGKCECGITDPNYVPPHVHNFVEGKCSCGETDPDYVPPHTHDYKGEETKAPTCTEKGTTTYTCSCGDSYTEDIPLKDHTYVDDYCSVCGQRDPSVPIVIVLSLEADKTQAVKGETVNLSALLNGEALENVTFTVVDGPATVSGNVLTVKDTAKDGEVIKVQTEYDGTKSNVVSITVIPSTHIDSIVAEVLSDKVVKGSTVALLSTVSPAGIAQSFVQWKITEGEDYATIQGNSLTVFDSAETGAIIKVVAYFGENESNVLTLTVTDPAIFSLSLEADKSQAVPGAEIILSALLNGESIADAVYTVISGPATVNGNILTISTDAVDGDVIKVKTTHKGVDSNVVVISVIPNTHVDTITLGTESDSQSIMKGATIGLVATVNPDGVARDYVKFRITEGENYAYINGNALCVYPDAPTDAIIKVEAYFGEVVSDAIELKVAATQEEINAGKYFIMVSNNHITVDKFGATGAVINVTVRDYNFQVVEDLKLSYEIIEGDDSILALENNGNTCKLSAVGHGTVVVQVAVPGTNVTEKVTVDVIVPPTAVTIPEVFEERRDITYKFSMRDSLPFAIGISGDKVAQDYSVTFRHEDGSTDGVAVYENGMITFLRTGKVTVNVQSASGSRKETTNSYTFDINNGYNVYSFAEMRLIGQKEHSYNGEELNIVVLEKPVDPDGYNYGYDLVPPVALLPDAEQTVEKILKGYDMGPVIDRFNGKTVKNYYVNSRIQFVNKSAWINGNGHDIDASQIRVFDFAEFNTWRGSISNGSEYKGDISSLFSVETWTREGSEGEEGSAIKGTDYSVKLYNFEVKGNAPITHNPGAVENGGLGFGMSGGAVYTGISIGSYTYDTHYYIDADNITVSACEVGMRLIGIVGNGTISDIYAYNCYSTGIMSKSSIVTFENVKFGPCGACGIELSPEECNEAGLKDNENQQITIKGTIDAAANINNGSTSYFTNYTIQGATVPQIITGNTNMYHDNQVAHIRNTKGEFIFVSLIFKDMNTFAENTSTVEYPAYQEGGIIDITELPTDGSVDTTHQFIRMPIMVTITGMGTVQAGSALFFNHNYGK